jgi:hypothetical protein
MSESDAAATSSSVAQPPGAREGQLGGWPMLDLAAAAAVTTPSPTEAPAVNQGIAAMRDELRRRCEDVSRGNLASMEEILVSQAVVLHALFTAALAGAQQHLLGEPDAGERLIRVALRAQAQTVRVVEALAAMKRPQVEAREAAAAAPQFPLIRIDLSERDSSPTEKSGGTDHELRSNTPAPAPALRDDPPLAALDARYWAAVARRQG